MTETQEPTIAVPHVPAIVVPKIKQRIPEENTIYIGKKTIMNYVIAVVSQFNNGSNQVKAKARGRTISALVDVTQIVKNKFIPTLKVSDVKLSTEELKSEDGRTAKVSSMELTMTK